MNIEDIKVGETYNVRVRVGRIDTNRFVCQPLNQDGTPSDFCHNYFNFAEAEAFSPLSTENGIKNTETAPKYDPKRLFRKGDIVEVDTHGRDIADSMKKAGLVLGKRYAVTADEGTTGHDIGYVSFIGDDGIEHNSMFFWLKLVTPVEELEPYSVSEATVQYLVKEDNKKVVAQFCKLYHPHAKAAAEAE